MSTKILMLPGTREFNIPFQGYLERQYPGQYDFVDVKASMFASGEMHAQIIQSVRGERVFLLQSSSGSWDIPEDFSDRIQAITEAFYFLNYHPDKQVQQAAQKLALHLTGIEIAGGIDSSNFVVFLARQFKRSVNDDFMLLVAALDALKRANPEWMQLVAAFLGYQRQDRKDKARVPITAKAIFDILEKVGGKKLDNIITSELHVPQAQGFSDGPVDNLPMTWVFAADILATIKKHNIDPSDILFVSPDLGGEKRVESVYDSMHRGADLVSEHFESQIGVYKKTRLDNQKTRPTLLVPHRQKFSVQNKIAIIIDDIGDSLNSVLEPAKRLKQSHAAKVFVYVAHGVLTERAVENLNNPAIDGVVTTNTLSIPPYMQSHVESGKLSQLGVHPFFAESVAANSTHGSVSELFSIEAVRDFSEKGGIPLGDHLKFG